MKEKLKKNLRLKNFFFRLSSLKHGFWNGWNNLAKLLMPCRFRLCELEERFWYKILDLYGLYKLNWNVLIQTWGFYQLSSWYRQKNRDPSRSNLTPTLHPSSFYFQKSYNVVEISVLLSDDWFIVGRCKEGNINKVALSNKSY